MSEEANRRMERARALSVELAAALGPFAAVRVGEPLARRTTLRVGGPAELFVEPEGEEDLARALEFAARNGLPWFALGRGSNLLVRDGGIRGLVVSLSRPAFAKVVVEGDRLKAGAGVPMRTVAYEGRRVGLGGFEWMEGIPGSVGGGLRMNAGAMGSAMCDRVERVRWIDSLGNIGETSAAEMGFEYRACPFLVGKIAIGAEFRGISSTREEIERALKACSEKRWSSQPKAPSAGCMFKNPTGIPSGKLIQELGLKGAAVGGVRVSEVHGNFFVTEGEVKAAQVLELIEIVRARAMAERGIDLHPEVQIVGEEENGA